MIGTRDQMIEYTLLRLRAMRSALEATEEAINSGNYKGAISDCQTMSYIAQACEMKLREITYKQREETL
jgi:hypothetical protein